LFVRGFFLNRHALQIIPALQSRCTRFRFAPLTPDQMRIQIDRVVHSEGKLLRRVGCWFFPQPRAHTHTGLTVTEDGFTSLIKLATGDMRKALNLLQSTSMGFPLVDTRTVYLCAGHPLPTDIAAIVEHMLTLPLADAIARACLYGVFCVVGFC
jgi:replication factor C subunit 3/5